MLPCTELGIKANAGHGCCRGKDMHPEEPLSSAGWLLGSVSAPKNNHNMVPQELVLTVSVIPQQMLQVYKGNCHQSCNPPRVFAETVLSSIRFAYHHQ